MVEATVQGLRIPLQQGVVIFDAAGNIVSSFGAAAGGATSAKQDLQIATEGSPTDAPVADNTTTEGATARTGISLWKRIANLLIALLGTTGATNGAAVVTDANGTLQQYLRGAVTLLAKTIPATTSTAVTPDDATALASRAVWVGGGGNLSVRLSGAPTTTVVFTAVPDGTLLPLSVVRVMAATTATNIVVLN